MILLVVLVAIILATIVWFYVSGIDYMKKKHPDYNGEDFLNHVNKTAGRDSWDDNLYDEIY
jgi:hypothetical protein